MRGKIVRHIGRKNIAFVACEDLVERFFHAGMVNQGNSVTFHEMEVGDTVEGEPIVVKHEGEDKDRLSDVRLIAKAGDFRSRPEHGVDPRT